MRNLISRDIQVGNLEGVGPLGTNLIVNNNTAPQRFTTYMNIFFQLLILGAGLYSIFNFILAGYKFLNAGSDPKKIQEATSQIWQSIVGLLIVAGAFIIALIVGWVIFKDFDALLNPRVIIP